MVLPVFILLVGKLLDLALMVLPVFILLVGKLLDLALRLPQVLLRISTAPVFSIKFRFQLSDASIHPGHGLLSSLKGISLGLINASLHVLNLSLEQLLLSFQRLCHILLSTELISKTCSIDHSSLCLFFRKSSLTSHLIAVSLKG